jgi:hypothetical protein
VILIFWIFFVETWLIHPESCQISIWVLAVLEHIFNLPALYIFLSIFVFFMVFAGMSSSVCFLEPPVQPPSGNPCVPSPCGPNSQCRAVGNTPACSCLPNYVGRAPNCRPECTISAECASNLACQNEHCRDPCPGSCGVQATCVVVKHAPLCTCQPGFTGDPFTGCSLIPRKTYILYS